MVRLAIGAERAGERGFLPGQATGVADGRKGSVMAKTSLTVAAFSAALLGAGAAHAQRFIDNGDGTLTDRQSGLMWEKKTSTGGGVHDVSGRYT
jgi:hypothetical protein